jgi:hypothetical protein
MKKLSFLISLFCIFTAFEASARCVNITTPHGSTLYINQHTTVAELFRECRNHEFFGYAQRLVLYFGGYEILEQSEASYKPLCDFGNHIEYARVGFIYEYDSNFYSNEYKERTISIRASNGMIRTCRANQTPAYFFRSCRNAGNCPSTAPMTLKFGTYEIKENTAAANKFFYEFNTDSNSAYVMYWNYNTTLENDESFTALLGATICGLGFIYFLDQITK